MDLTSGSNLSLREILSITLSAFAEPAIAISPTWMPVSFPSCLLPNSEGLKGAPLLLPGEWMCLKVLSSQKSSPTFVLSFGVLPFAASLLELLDPPLQLHCAT